jgi:tRNA G46 methylase TrmB
MAARCDNTSALAETSLDRSGAARARSVALFAEHRTEELARRARELAAALGGSTPGTRPESGVGDEKEAPPGLEAATRVLFAGSHGQCYQPCDAGLLTALCPEGEREQRAVQQQPKRDTQNEGPGNTQAAPSHKEIGTRLWTAQKALLGSDALIPSQAWRDRCRGKAHSCATRSFANAAVAFPAVTTDGDGEGDDSVCAVGHLNVNALFRPLADFGSEKNAPRTQLQDGQDISNLKLEFGCGSGEWLLAQAAADPDPAALWLGCEPRVDRIALCSERAALAALAEKNGRGEDAHGGSALRRLAWVCGRAEALLDPGSGLSLAPGSLSHAFVNHPEPPHRINANNVRAPHMLTPHFFQLLWRTLRPGGTVTIVTDNKGYAMSLAEQLDSLDVASAIEMPRVDTDIATCITTRRMRWESPKPSNTDDTGIRLLKQFPGGLCIWVGLPGEKEVYLCLYGPSPLT